MATGSDIATEKKPLLQKENVSIEVEDVNSLPTVSEEAWDIVKLGIPIFIARLSFVGMKTTDTALLGHVSREALSAAALSDLWTMCSQVLLYGQVLGVFIGGGKSMLHTSFLISALSYIY